MGYTALETFADLSDGKRLYHAGESFPREGLVVSEKRLAQLAGSDNRMGRPLIVKKDEEKPTRKRGRPSANRNL